MGVRRRAIDKWRLISAFGVVLISCKIGTLGRRVAPKGWVLAFPALLLTSEAVLCRCGSLGTLK